ncbi:MAG: anti-sigma factor family protein [Phycisphaerales bacterium]
MADSRPDNAHDRPTGDDLSIGALLRLGADDELTAPERERLAAHLRAHPEDAARLDTERAIRARVGQTLERSPAAPADLRDRVASILRGDADEAPVIRRTDRSFWRRSLAPLAIAASLLLVVSASIVIRQAAIRSGEPTWMDASFGAAVASFVEREHSRCVGLNDETNMKFVTNTLEGAHALMQDRLGTTARSLDLSGQGLELTGAGACHVPGEGKSVHLLYRPTDGRDGAVSLFVQAGAPGFQGVDESCICLSELAEGEEVLVWRRDGLVFYLVCPESDGPASGILDALDAPTSRSFL